MAVIKKTRRNTQTALIERIYSDLTTPFYINSNTLDVVTEINEDAVKASIKNIILTDRGERLFNPIMGGNIRALLFEQMSPQTESLVRDYVEEAINNFEPRANLIDVIVTVLEEANAYAVTIVFSVINKSEPVTLDLLLNRTR